MHRPDLRQIAILIVVATASLIAASVLVAILETFVAVPNASIVYLAAVVATAIASGLPGAIVASIASFLLYDFFFTEPRFTMTIKDPGEWLSVILLLFVGIVVGQLAALQRSRAEVAQAREREARALFHLSRELATRKSTREVLPILATALQADTSMDRIWIALGPDDSTERVVADTRSDPRPPVPGRQQVLKRMPGDQPAQWIRLHQPTARPRGAGRETYRVRIESGGSSVGSIWAIREASAGPPSRTETRLLAAAADQLAQALALDQLAAEAQAVEVARQSDALKSALLQSVSHDLRTPLATIRAAAGTLRRSTGADSTDQQESADAIDREVDYLNRLVTNLLDLSRIEAGALRVDRDVFEIGDLVEQTLARLGPRMAGRRVEVRVGNSPVGVDPVYVDSALTNVIENAIRHTPADAPIRISAQVLANEPYVRLTIEDGGGGVPDDVLDRLFDKFYRVPGRDRGSRAGTGIGLAVVRGLTEALGGRVRARPSELGGLAVDLDLPAATVPAGLAAGTLG